MPRTQEASLPDRFGAIARGSVRPELAALPSRAAPRNEPCSLPGRAVWTRERLSTSPPQCFYFVVVSRLGSEVRFLCRGFSVVMQSYHSENAAGVEAEGLWAGLVTCERWRHYPSHKVNGAIRLDSRSRWPHGSVLRQRNKEGQAHFLSTCCAPGSTLGASVSHSGAVTNDLHDHARVPSSCIPAFLWSSEFSTANSLRKCTEWYDTSLNPPGCYFYREQMSLLLCEVN